MTSQSDSARTQTGRRNRLIRHVVYAELDISPLPGAAGFSNGPALASHLLHAANETT
jgi:hypothetical protein